MALYTLSAGGGLEARITNFGGVIVALNVPDRNGAQIDVMLGYDDLAAYERGGVYGAVIGRYANRIGSNGTFPLGNAIVQLERTSPGQNIVIQGPRWVGGIRRELRLRVRSRVRDPGLPFGRVEHHG